jgi:6-phosphogluconolactonase
MIWVYDDPEALSHAAAGFFVQRARQAAQDKGWFSVALSGGHTPQRTYELLASEPYRERVAWGQVHVFWGDERCVPSDDPRSNAHMARQALLDHVPIPAAQIHPIDCDQEPRLAAARYEDLLRGFFADEPPRFDFVFLGLGENGHTASLFPSTPVLEEQERWVSDVTVAEQDLHRLTLTAPVINWAAVVVFLVAGASKASVLRDVLQGQPDPRRLPAQLVRPKDGNLYWFVDREAGALLSRQA